MIGILDMVDDTPPAKPYKTEVIYGTGGIFKVAPEKMTRNQKMNYIGHKFAGQGASAINDKFVVEFRCSRGLSAKSFNAARDYGLYLNEASA